MESCFNRMSSRIGAPHHPMGAPSKVFLIEETKSPPTIVIPAFAGMTEWNQ